MAYSYDQQNGDLIINGFDQGISSSPHTGMGSVKNANINTLPGEVMASYSRVKQSNESISAGTIQNFGGFSNTYLLNITSPATGGAVLAGSWFIVTNSTIAEVPNGNYFILQNGTNGSQIQISARFAFDTGPSITSALGGTADIRVSTMGRPVDYAVEKHGIWGSDTYRYYILTENGTVWVHDSGVTMFEWGAIDSPDTSPITSTNNASGILILNGWLHVIVGHTINVKPVTTLWEAWGSHVFSAGALNSPPNSTNPHRTFLGHQSTGYIGDGNYIASVFPTTGVPNISSNWSYFVSSGTTICSLNECIGGGLPSTGGAGRIPVVMFSTGTLPTTITANTIYYLDYSEASDNFQMFTASTGGVALNMSGGATGVQYFNTYSPNVVATYIFSKQALTIPSFEIIQSIAEIGNELLIGCGRNTVYRWNQSDAQASDLIILPEGDVKQIVTVNNMGYVFAGNKGNIYITNGSTASRAIQFPDYPSGQIEPYYEWGGAMFMRGRIYFSIKDQTATKTGELGGVWSFIPSGNFVRVLTVNNTVMQLEKLVMENTNSYGTTNGYAILLIKSFDQKARGPQYWTAWENSITAPNYGIDFSDTVPGTPVTIETDIVPIGTFLKKKTLQQLEYKLAAPLVTGDSIQIEYRTDLSEAFTVLSNVVTETGSISGYYKPNFQQKQWLQLRITLTPNGLSTSSFVRLSEIRIR